MIDSISVTSDYGKLTIDLKDPSTSGFFIVDIEGLGPPKADIITTTAPSVDGSRFNMSRTNQRNLTLTIGVLGLNNDVDGTRQSLYRYFPIKRSVRFGIKLPNRDVVIDGYVESIEAQIFNKVSHNVISLICTKPYFRKRLNDVIYLNAAIPMFEYPFQNEGLDPTLIMGEIISRYSYDVNYEGDVPTGLTIQMTFAGPVEGSIRLQNHVLTNFFHEIQTMAIDTRMVETITGGSIQNGDEIFITTHVGSKRIFLKRGSTYYSIINALEPGTTWLTIYPGTNALVFNAEIGNPYMSSKVLFDVLYEGV